MWEDTLKGYKKINMENMKKIVDHILITTGAEVIALSSLEPMVVSTYKRYNPTQKTINIKSILANMLKTRGYAKVGTGHQKVMHDDLSGKRVKGTFYKKVKK